MTSTFVDIIFDPNNTNNLVLLLLLGKNFFNIDFSSDGKEVFLSFLEEDNFSEETLQNENNKILIKNLELVKQEAKDFHELNLCDAMSSLMDKNKIETTSKKIRYAYQNYELQISRLRMVIQPEYNITRVVNPISNNCYLAARGYWFVSYQVKKRIFTKNFGREDDFVGGRTDKLANEIARKEMQELCKNEYLLKYVFRG